MFPHRVSNRLLADKQTGWSLCNTSHLDGAEKCFNAKDSTKTVIDEGERIGGNDHAAHMSLFYTNPRPNQSFLLKWLFYSND